jgi:uncharacterized protein (TIGR02452 family)
MSTFTGHIDRRLATRLGREAVAIGEAGEYRSVSGVMVDIKAMLAAAIDGTVSYPPATPFDECSPGPHDTKIDVVNETTLSASKCLIEAGCDPVLLNFASATNPGGGFLNGARAQEEYLARSSCLYHCIRSSQMYAFHRKNHDPFSSDYAIYSPCVPVIRDDSGDLLDPPYSMSMITCAAVKARKLGPGRLTETSQAMWRRILKVLSLGVSHGHDAIILGAWGCGAFGNKGEVIANLFHKALFENFKGAYRWVTFAIVDWSAEERFIGPFEAQFVLKA